MKKIDRININVIHNTIALLECINLSKLNELAITVISDIDDIKKALYQNIKN